MFKRTMLTIFSRIYLKNAQSKSQRTTNRFVTAKIWMKHTLWCLLSSEINLCYIGWQWPVVTSVTLESGQSTHIQGPNPGNMHRLVHGLIVSACTGFFVYQAYQNIDMYFKYPTTRTYSKTTLGHVGLPRMEVCLKYGFDIEFLELQGYGERGREPSHRERERAQPQPQPPDDPHLCS